MFRESFQNVPDRELLPADQVGVNGVTEPFIPSGWYPLLTGNSSDNTTRRRGCAVIIHAHDNGLANHTSEVIAANRDPPYGQQSQERKNCIIIHRHA
jgi:hypothetical protein